MAVLKQIKFGSGSATPIAKSVVAINQNSQNALSVVATNDQLSDNADPTYTIALAVDGQTITMPSGGLKTALALKYEAAVTEGEGQHAARIVLADQDGATGYNVLSSVPVSDLVGSGMVSSATYNPSTGELTIVWVGSGADTVIDLGALLDIQDIVIKSDSTDFLSFAAIDPGTETGGQAQIGVKLADVTYTATSGSTAATLTVDTTNGKILDASDAIPAIQGYVADVLANASTNLAVTAEGDNYVSASVDAATDNKHVIVETNVQDLTAFAGTRGTWAVTDAGDGTAATKALSGETAASISGVAESLADSSDIATNVATYVGGVVAAEAARADAEVERAIKSLDVADTAQAGKYVSQVVETDGKIAVSRANVSDAVLTGYAKGTAPASLDIAATDDVKTAIAKLEHQVDAAEAAGATVVAEGTDAGNNMTIAETTDQTDGHKTYTINLTDVASAQGLADEITARKAVDGQSGNTYTANSNANYISNATSLNDADVKLDAQVKANADAIAAITATLNGTLLTFNGIAFTDQNA